MNRKVGGERIMPKGVYDHKHMKGDRNPMKRPEVAKKVSEALSGRIQSKESNAKRSESMMNHPVSKETGRKISKALTGRKLSKEHTKNTSIGVKLLWQDSGYREKQNHSREKNWKDHEFRGRMKKSHDSIEFREKQSQITAEMWKDPTYRKNHVDSLTTPEHRRKQGQSVKKRWQDPGFRERTLKAMFRSMELRPTKPEIILDKFLQQLLPNEYKYVGDGSFLVGYKSPDFVNINGQKKIIELFGDYCHSEKITGVPNDQHVRERKDIFKKYGYQTLIVWEYEISNLKMLKDKILRFNQS